MSSLPTSAAAYAASQRPPVMGNGPHFDGVIVEPAVGWWTGNNQWGNRFQGNYPASVDLPIAVTTMPALPGPPQQVGISLFRSEPVGQEPQNADVYCELTYGAGGTSNTILLDWAQGGTFSIPANTVRIVARGYAPHDFPGFLNSAVYDPHDQNPPHAVCKTTLGATIAVKGVAPAQPVTFTSPVIRLLPTDAVSIPVPVFGRRVWIMLGIGLLTPVVLADYQVQLFTRSGLCVGGPYQVQEDMLTNGLQLPGSVGSVIITNKGLTNTFAGCIFQLGL